MRRLTIVNLVVALMLIASAACGGEGAVNGRFELDTGKPLADGLVFFFKETSTLDRPVLGKFWRVPDFADRTDESGMLATVLPEGTYYIGAVKRMSAVSVGPPVDGDYFLPSHDRNGVYRTVTVRDGDTADLGAIKGIQRYSSRRAAYRGKITAIEGKLTNADGSPAAGMFVFAYLRPDTQQERPQFVSAKSDAAGRYRLLLDKGRIVYLKARVSYAGGAPRPGTPIGMYGDDDSQKPVAARTGSITRNIDMLIKPFAQRVQ